jgi:flagellar basal-body rod protein FlgB
MIESIMANENYVLAKKMLDASAIRHDLIATNLANVETPGFKRLDLDPGFSKQLDSLVQKNDLRGLRELEVQGQVDTRTRASRPDGNNVELDRELLELSRNALEYDFLAEYASNSLSRIKTAITGRVV